MIQDSPPPALGLPPLGLYVHIPWCVRKCPYCDFNSHAISNEAAGEIPEAAYIQALIADLESQLPSVWGRVVQTIFIGGGTPSLFSATGIATLLTAIKTRIRCKPDLEVTLEANPGTLEAGRFTEFRSAGINRLSIGVQSFNDNHLQALGRIHDGKTAIKAIESVHKSGYDNFNIDLMFGLPQQNDKSAFNDIQQALKLNPPHLSHYELTLEPNTAFHHSPPTLPTDDTIAKTQERCRQTLNNAGYNAYEISAYSITNRECRHNLNYWRFGDYLGIGAGAHGKITDQANSVINRTRKQKHPKRYLQAPQDTRINPISTQDLSLEFMMNSLRLHHGVTAESYELRTGQSLSSISEILDKARKIGLLSNDNRRIQATDKGLRYLNDLLGLFLKTSP